MAGGSTRPSLAGRKSELDRLKTLLRAVADGRGGSIVVEGEAGIGKSRLLDEAVAGAADGDVAVLRGRGEELDARRPFGAIADALGVVRTASDPRRAEIARLLFEDHRARSGNATPAGGGEFRVVELVVELVEQLCAFSPVALVLDDLHWADQATLSVLNHLNGVVDQVPLVILGACRPHPRSRMLARLIADTTERGSPPVRLGPLGDDDVSAVLLEILGREPGPRLSRQVAAAGGNPFFVTELVAAHQADGSVSTDGTTADIRGPDLPRAMSQTILHRMSLLSVDTFSVLQIASILGSRFSLEELALVLQRPPPQLEPGLDEAVSAGVVDRDDLRFGFRHDLYREALYADIPEVMRASLHHEVALALIELNAPALRVAEHFLRGADPGDDVARSWLVRAADQLTVQAPGVAADLLGRAVELFEAGPEKDAVLVDWAVSLESAGRLQEAVAVCLDVVARDHEPRITVRLHLALVRMFAAMRRPADVEHHVRLALGVVGLSDAQRARALQLVAMLSVADGDYKRAEETAVAAQRASEAARDAVSARLVAHVRASLALIVGHLGDARRFAMDAAVGDDPAPDARVGQGWHFHRQMARVTLGLTLIRMDRLDEAEAVLGEARRAIEESGFRLSLVMAQRGLMMRRYLGGDWDDAVAEYEAIVDLCDEFAESSDSLVDPSSMRSLIALHQGDLATARRVLPASYAPARSVGGCWPEQAHALVFEASGSPERALATLSAAWEYNTGLGAFLALPVLGADLVRLSLSYGRPANIRLEDVMAGVDTVADANPEVASIAGAALRCHGLVEDDPAQLLDASSRFVKGRRPLEGALACEEAAELFARRGLLGEARPLFDDAIARFRALGASWDAGRAAHRARARGIRLGQRGGRDRPANGWGALTTSERRVVGLVAQGLTNAAVAEQLFLSRHTVKAHIASALKKLSLSSRAELARVATRRAEGAPE